MVVCGATVATVVTVKGLVGMWCALVAAARMGSPGGARHGRCGRGRDWAGYRRAGPSTGRSAAPNGRTMSYEAFELDTRDGVPVMVHRWEPDRLAARGVVNLAHGMGEHARRYDHVAAALNDAGWAAYIEDHRGHGITARDEDGLGHLADRGGWALLLDDLHRVTLRAQADHPGLPVVLLGHSMGSFLAQQYLFTFPEDLDAMVLSGSSGPAGPIVEAGALLARLERRRLGPRGRSTLLESLVGRGFNRAFEPARTESDWLSRDAEMVDACLADPLCGQVKTTQFYLDLFSGLRVIGQVERVRAVAPPQLPVYLFAGTDDPVGGADGIASLAAHYQAAGLLDVTIRLYEGGRHEMLNETNRDEVIAELLAWLDTRVGAAAG